MIEAITPIIVVIIAALVSFIISAVLMVCVFGCPEMIARILLGMFGGREGEK